MTRRRLLFSLLATTLVLGITAAPAQAQQGANNRLPIVIEDIALDGVQVVNGVLTATGGTVSGTIAGLPFTTDITDFALQVIPDDPATPAAECSVLHLELGPINLALLGLHVDTSEICLDITATEGGGLLGDLLCGLAGGAALPVPVLPTGDELTGLLGGLVELLNGALNQPSQAAGAQADESVCTGAVEVLHLVLGPLDLSLLGLNVSLDNCDDGPVQVCISATPGEGLLGDLLGGLAGGGLPDISVTEITRLGRQVTRALADGVLSDREIRQLTNLVRRLG